MLGSVTIVGGEQGKGRAFSGAMLAYLTCNAVHFGDGELRPVWAVLATDGGSAKPFLANLRLARPATFNNRTLKFLSKLAYRFDQQQHPEGSLLTVYLPAFFEFEATAAEDSLKFIVLVESARVQAFDWDRARARAWLKKLRRTIPDDAFELVPFFAAYLDRRCKLPLPASLDFQAQLLSGLISQGGVHQAGGGGGRDVPCQASGLDELGLHRPLYMSAGHDAFKDFCATEVQVYVRSGGVL